MNKSVNLNRKAIKPKRVIILGSKGFIASELKTKLKSLDINVLAISKSKINLIQTKSTKSLSRIIKNDDVIVFISAEAPVKNHKMLINNILMCDNFIKSVRKKNINYLLYISSDAVYKDTKNKINEQSCAMPNSLHGIMHLLRENMIIKSITNPTCIVRPTLIYGAKDPHNGYGPNKFIRESSLNKDISLFGKGEELRDHIYIEDVISIIKEVILFKTTGILNAVSGDVTSFHDVAKLVIKSNKSRSKTRFTKRLGKMPHGGYRAFNNIMIKKLFPNIKIHSLKQGIKKTIKFMNLSL